MSFEQTIPAALTADAPLNALIVGRVRPLALIQGETRPAIAYQITDRRDPSPTHDGPSSFIIATYDIVIVAATYADAATISEHVRRVLGTYAATAGGVRIVWTRFDDETDIEQQPEPGTEKPVFVRVQTYRAMYRAAA